MKQEMQAYGDWVKGLRKWTRLGHFSFSDSRSPQSAKRTVRNFLKWLDPKAKFILVAEPNKLRKGCHVHCLIEGLTSIRCLKVVKLWHKKKYGNARLFPYNCSKAGAYYLCKHPEELDVDDA